MDTGYLKGVAISILTSFVCIFLIFYIVRQVNIIDRDDVTIQYAALDSSETALELRFTLAFYEEAVEGKGSYANLHTVADGTNVKKGGKLVELYNIASDDRVELIEKIDRRIAFLKLCSDMRGGSLDTVNYEKDVKDRYGELIDSIASGKLSSINKAGEEWMVAKSKRNISIGITNGYKEQIAELERQKQELISGMGYIQGSVSAPASGVYYSAFDGYERLIDPEMLFDMGYDELMALSDISGEDTDGGLGKIIVSGKWYAFACVSLDRATGMKIGSSYSCSFYENGCRANVTLERIVADYKNNQSVCVFSSNEDISRFVGYRFISGELTVALYEGIGIPCSAVRCVDGETGVYIVDGNKARFRRVDIIDERDGRYIVVCYDKDHENYKNHVKLYDSVIISGRNVFEGRYIELTK